MQVIINSSIIEGSKLFMLIAQCDGKELKMYK